MQVHLPYPWLILAVAGVLLVWGVSLLAVRLWTRRQVITALMRQEGMGDEGQLVLPDSRPEDQTAREIIQSYRRRYLLKWWPGTTISFKAINEMSLELVRDIAQVYYPLEDRPELKASLADLVALHQRVGTRLAAWLETRPMRPFKDLELATVVRYHGLYQRARNHWSYDFIKRHHLDKVARWGWTAINYANPWHWGSKAAYHGGKEVAARLLMTRIVDLVGEEAVRIYGWRRPPAIPNG